MYSFAFVSKRKLAYAVAATRSASCDISSVASWSEQSLREAASHGSVRLSRTISLRKILVSGITEVIEGIQGGVIAE